MDDDERAAVAAQYTDVKAAVDQLQERLAGLRQQLLDEGAGSRPAGALRVLVLSSRRLNVDRFRAKYDPVEWPQFYATAPVAARAKALDDDSCYDDGPVSVRVVDA